MNTVNGAAIGGTFSATITCPTATTTPCRNCDVDIEHVGELIVHLCDNCLAVLAGDADVSINVPSTQRRDCDDEAQQHCDLNEEDENSSHDVYIMPIEKAAPPSGKLFADHMMPMRRDVDPAKQCGTCGGETGYVCPGAVGAQCSRRCCNRCVDDTGRCPHCGDEEVE